MIDFRKCNVLDILSQRPPAVYVDRIVSFDMITKMLVAEKYVREDEHLLQGHFYNNPVVPAILTIEALSQACHLCGYAVTESDPDYVPVKGPHEHLAISINVKFKNKVAPMDTLLLYARFKEYVNMVSVYSVKAINKFDNKIVAVGEIIGIAKKINGEAENH